jgi:Tetracyclin repressor-like, C-terminal domain
VTLFSGDGLIAVRLGCARGFDRKAQLRVEAVAVHGAESLLGMIDMGRSYLAFARSEPAIFRLMFGQNPRLKTAEHVQARGRACFQGVIEDVAKFCAANEVKGDAAAIALDLWTFVHGAACLEIDEDYSKVAPGLDVDALVARAAPRLLSIE